MYVSIHQLYLLETACLFTFKCIRETKIKNKIFEGKKRLPVFTLCVCVFVCGRSTNFIVKHGGCNFDKDMGISQSGIFYFSFFFVPFFLELFPIFIFYYFLYFRATNQPIMKINTLN